MAPLYADLHAQASADADADWNAFVPTFRQRHRARIGIRAPLAPIRGSAMHSMFRALALLLVLGFAGTILACSRSQQNKLDDLQTA